MKLFIAIALAGCVSTTPEVGSVTRMTYAPPRDRTCDLQFVQPSMLELSPLGHYDVLGYVNIHQLAAADPYAEANRQLVRPRACELGGTAVSIMISATNTSSYGDASATVYAVLREKAAAPPPQTF